MQDFRRLAVWQRAHELTLSTYRITGRFPPAEVYGITSQLKRAAASIPANIAEGCGRESSAELARFLYIAQGSASELEYHLLLARDLKFLSAEDYTIIADDVNRVRRMLTLLIQRVRQIKRSSREHGTRPASIEG